MYKIPATTLFLGKNLIFVPECHSTNDMMLLLCQKDRSSPEGTLIITAQQTAGRGQRGNTWEAEPGMNLTFTVLVKPTFLPVTRQFYLNIFAALGIRDFLTEFAGLKVQIKWPNDIIANQKKICGILIENQVGGSTITNSAIGIGLNINQERFSIDTACSLKLLTGRSHDLSGLLEKLLHHLETRYLQLRSGRQGDLMNDYLANLLGKDENLVFEDANGEFSGIVRGIGPTGELLIESGATVRSYGMKEVRFVNYAERN